jgi:(2Fe-2S) ferredoxin
LKKETSGTLLFESGCHGFCQQGPLVNILLTGILYIKVEVDDIKEIFKKALKMTFL